MNQTIEFIFSVKDKVKTTLGDIGIISMCAKDDGQQNNYYVNFKGGTGAWYTEDLLTLFKE